MSNLGRRRYSKNNLAYRVLENSNLDELQLTLRRMPSEELQKIPQILPISRFKTKSISLETAEIVRTAAIRLYSSGKIEELFELICSPLHEFSKDELGDSFEDPNEEQINQLTSRLISEFGSPRTRMFYAYIIDSEARASPHLLQHIGSGKPLEIPVRLEIDAKREQPTPRPAPTETVKQSRRNRRQEDHIARNWQKSQQLKNRLLEKQRSMQARNKIEPKNFVDAETPTLVGPSVIPMKKEIHPHISQFKEASGVHELTGRICNAFIHYNDGGKIRPCVIIAVTPTNYVVRPLYSNAYWPAGLWRAVRLQDWIEAGLDHQSNVGVEAHMVKITESYLRGKLSLRDWNRICLGEIN